MNKRHTASVFCLALLLAGVISAQGGLSLSEDIIVRGNTIEVLGPGPNLQTLINGIGDEDSDNPYLIKLGPGEYPIGTALLMTDHISIMGSGPDVTILKGAISAVSQIGTLSAIVGGDDNTALTDLAIVNNGGTGNSIALYLGVADMRVERVHATAMGGTVNNFAIVVAMASPTLTHVVATASGIGTSTSYGVFIGASSIPVLTHVTAKASGGANSYGVRNFSNTAAPQIFSSHLDGPW